MPRLALLWTASTLLISLQGALEVQAKPPPEGDCPAVSGVGSAGAPSEDAAPVLLREGMVLTADDLLALRALLPPEIWKNREVFFFEGMRMEIGACHRRYPTPGFFQEATEQHAGEARLDGDGNLRDFVAGLPFPPEAISADDPQEAAKWAWNLAMRFQGAGPHGKFRIVDFPGRIGGTQSYEGEFYQLITNHRSDLAAADYRVGDAKDKLFAAGGEFKSPFNVRHLAWRQFRPMKSLRRYEESDDTFVYVPDMRKPRRSGTTWLDGLFFPRFSRGGEGGGGALAFGGAGAGGIGGGSINPTSGLSAAQSEHYRRGLVGQAIRPNAYIWRSHGERDVLAPLNGTRVGYPFEKNRNFGPSGLSMASDRWDVRRAVVIEGALKVQPGDYKTVTLYVDYLTQMPLYWISRASRRRLHEIGIFVHRYSDDNSQYPAWPDGSSAAVFDPVAAAFYDAATESGGWRRESYDVRSTPPPSNQERGMTTVDALTRGK